MGIRPNVCHMNEGHSAFASMERLAQLISNDNVDLKTGMEIVSRSNIFTTHTPVAAGHEEFPAEMIRPYLAPLQETLKTEKDEILSWGQRQNADPDSPFSMFVLALRLSQYCNGVSELHGRIARRMWAQVWPGRPEEEVPIGHITNGVHGPSWISHELARLFNRYLGPDWNLHPWSPDIFKRIEDIYDEELWRAHEMTRSQLVRFCRDRMVHQYARRNAPRAIMESVASVLDQDILTIGFARRFATYKRSYLLLQDPDRLEALINSESQPVQFIFAGKAHPKDNEGKDLIKGLIQFAQKESVRHRFIFLEDYDPDIARHLVRGTDVWLNTPRRPLEACGTSGMKAAMNGVLNLSVLDGWWCEGYSEERGWRIGSGEEYSDHQYQDTVESQDLYNILEDDVIACFYERKNGDIPARWLAMMKASIKMAIQDFCSHKMVDEYTRRFYLPAAKRFQELLADEAAEAKRLRDHIKRLRTHWGQIKIDPPKRDSDAAGRVGETFRVTTTVYMKNLRAKDIEVELYYGRLESVDILTDTSTAPMIVQEDRGNGEYLYACSVSCNFSGRFGFTARVTPKGDDQIKFTPGLITWA
jgi:starch phosphorylase